VVIAPPAGGRAADREPAAVLLPGNNLTLFFRSDRSGDTELWSATPVANGPATNLTQVTHNGADDAAPAPLVMAPANPPWLLFRSNRSVALGQLSPRPDPAALPRASAPLPDTGAIRRQTGATTVVASALLRNRRRQLWDDLLVYTPQRPAGDPLRSDELYTRGTVGLYVSRPNDDTPITTQSIQRLRQLLARFLPINIRAVVILTPQMETELVYPGGIGPEDSYFDQYPFVEILGGLADASGVALPGWAFLLSNQVGQGSADPANLSSLQRRTYFPPPQ
jgi:hypothetical protein